MGQVKTRAIEGVKCPKCAEPMEQRPGSFYWRGDFRPGWVCVKCNSLWAIKWEEIPPLKGTGI